MNVKTNIDDKAHQKHTCIPDTNFSCIFISRPGPFRVGVEMGWGRGEGGKKQRGWRGRRGATVSKLCFTAVIIRGRYWLCWDLIDLRRCTGSSQNAGEIKRRRLDMIIQQTTHQVCSLGALTVVTTTDLPDRKEWPRSMKSRHYHRRLRAERLVDGQETRRVVTIRHSLVGKDDLGA